MVATIKTAISPFREPKTVPNANSIHFLDEDLALMPASGIPEEFRKLSRYLPVIVLVPKSAVHDKTTQKKPGPNHRYQRCLLTARCSEGLVEKSKLHRHV